MPARGAVALARLGVAGGAILASALVLTVFAILALVALLVAQLTQPAWTANTAAVLWLAVGIVFTRADLHQMCQETTRAPF